MTRLAGRSAVVTGAASGIGRAIAILFAEEGAQVLAIDRDGGSIPGAPRITPLEQDLTAEGAAALIVSRARAAAGHLDTLVNAAGVMTNALAERTSVAEWDRTFAVDLRAVFLLCQAAIPALRESRRGRIVNVASVMAERTDIGLAAYSAAKHGVAGLTRALALELGKDGVIANYLMPGAVLTGMTESTLSQPDIRRVWERKAALRRLGEPEEIARAALFLASDDASFVTGHGLVVDGGLTLRV